MNQNLVRAVAVAAMALLFVGTVLMIDWPSSSMDKTTNDEVAKTMFGQANDMGYGLILLFIGLLLLVALLGGVFLAKEEEE